MTEPFEIGGCFYEIEATDGGYLLHRIDKDEEGFVLLVFIGKYRTRPEARVDAIRDSFSAG